MLVRWSEQQGVEALWLYEACTATDGTSNDVRGETLVQDAELLR